MRAIPAAVAALAAALLASHAPLAAAQEATRRLPHGAFGWRLGALLSKSPAARDLECRPSSSVPGEQSCEVAAAAEIDSAGAVDAWEVLVNRDTVVGLRLYLMRRDTSGAAGPVAFWESTLRAEYNARYGPEDRVERVLAPRGGTRVAAFYGAPLDSVRLLVLVGSAGTPGAYSITENWRCDGPRTATTGRNSPCPSL